MTIRRLGIVHGIAKWDKESKQWYHAERSAWFENAPVLKSKSITELLSLVIKEGEKLYF